MIIFYNATKHSCIELLFAIILYNGKDKKNDKRI